MLSGYKNSVSGGRRMWTLFRGVHLNIGLGLRVKFKRVAPPVPSRPGSTSTGTWWSGVGAQVVPGAPRGRLMLPQGHEMLLRGRRALVARMGKGAWDVVARLEGAGGSRERWRPRLLPQGHEMLLRGRRARARPLGRATAQPRCQDRGRGPGIDRGVRDSTG